MKLLLGQNGSGKSSVLEAIHYLSLGRSFRTHLTNRVIMQGRRRLRYLRNWNAMSSKLVWVYRKIDTATPS